MRHILFTILILVCVMPYGQCAELQKVFAKEGHIYYFSDGKDEIQLTFNGKDSAPALSPDGKNVAFLRKSDREAYLAVGAPEDYLQSGPDAILADQVWIIGVDGKNEKLLVEDNNPDDFGYDKWEGNKVIAHIDDDSLQFSPDGKTLYFITSAWVTTGALHSVNIDGTNERFIAGANYLKVIDKGRYKGNLIIRQHRYFLAGGSYDWLWLFTPAGKELGPLGLDLNEDQLGFLYSDPIK